MKNSVNGYRGVTFVTCIAFIIYTYYSMLGFVHDTLTSHINICKLAICVISIYSIIANGKLFLFNGMHKMWFAWALYFVFIELVGYGIGISPCISLYFAPASYITAYYCVSHNNKNLRWMIYAFLVIFLLSIFMVFLDFKVNEVVFEDADKLNGNNLFFFVLCALPFIFLVKHPLISSTLYLLSLAICVITLKRSAMIAMVCIALVYIYSLLLHKKRKGAWKSILTIISVGVIGFSMLTTKLEGYLTRASQRIDNISEDEGSGRLPLYEDVISHMKRNHDLSAWVIGAGYGSIVATNHTNAHNDALQMLYEFGIVGLMFYLWMLYIMFKKLLQLHKVKHEYFTAYATSAIIVIMLGLVSNLVVFYSYFAFITFFWGAIDGYTQTNKTTLPSNFQA